MIKFATKSIKKIDIIDIPIGFSYEFVATYPDVVVWWNNLDKEQDKILEGFDENDIFDYDNKVKFKYLKIIVNEYKKSGKKLECSYGVFVDDENK